MSSSLGRIAIGLVGAAIGAPFGLSAIGFSVGSAIGGMIFAPDGPKTEGPRLGDTNVSSSSLGKIIPEHYGVTRSGGNMIWSAGLKEVKKVEEQGGKGGPTATTTTYTYFCSFAVVFGRGRANKVRRIWADGKLIYDTTGTSEVANNKYKFRFRRGLDDQPVDPLIAESINRRLAGMPDVSAGNQEPAKYTTMADLITQTAAGTGQRSTLYSQLLTARKAEAEAGLADGAVPDYRFTSAYRDLVYIIYDNMPLEDFGNRIPNITAEIVWEGASTAWATDSETPVVVGTAVPELGTSLPVPDGLMGMLYTSQKIVTNSGNTLRRFALSSKAEEGRNELQLPESIAQKLHSDMFVGWSLFFNNGPAVGTFSDLRIHTATVSGTIYATAKYTYPHFLFGNVQRDVLLSLGETGLHVTGAALLSSVPSFMCSIPRVISATSGDITATTNNEHIIRVTGNSVTFSRMSRTTAIYSDSVSLPTSFGGSATSNAGPVVYAGTFERYARVTAVRYGSNVISVHHLRPTIRRTTTGSDNVVTTTNISVERSGGKVSPFEANIQHIVGVVTDTNGGGTYVVASLVGGKTGVIGFDRRLKVIYNATIDFQAPANRSGLTGYRTSPGIVAFGYGTSIITIELVSGTHNIFDNVSTVPFSPNAQVFVESISGLLAWNGDTPTIYYIDRAALLTSLAAPLRSVVRSICQRAGMDEDELDVSGLPVAPVRGLSLTRAASGRANLEILTKAFFVEGIESDWKVKFRSQATDAVRRIKEKELGGISSPTGNVNWLETRAPEYSLPAQLNLNYADPIRDYQNGTAHQRRISAPISSMYSDTVENVELPMSILEADAQAIAERMLYQTWMHRESSKSRLPWTHADLDPGDLVEVEFEDGRVVTERLVKTTLGANFEVELESVRAGDPVYVASPSAVIPTTSVPGTTVSIPVPSRMFAFDIPLLVDYHTTNGAALRYYTALGADSERWRSGTVFLSWDGGTYNPAASVPLDVTWGQVVGSLGRPRALWSTDEDNTLRVAIVRDRGDIVSVTREDILNGMNKALIWNSETGEAEVIQFMNAELSPSGTEVILSNLVRGLRGTEYIADKHVDGEYFILLNEATMQMGLMETSRVSSTAYFKGVSSGQLVSSVQPVSMDVVGRSLMPWAPSRVRRSESGGDLTVTWNRRTRISGGWNMGSGVETVPLNEDSEYYEFYLINGDPEAFSPNDPTKYHVKKVVTAPSVTITAEELATYGVDLTGPVGVAVYQISAQVGRGFGRVGLLVP